ncbi:MAG: twin-arginine translocase TatA/TatE family subunit [Actinomycetota bacterium]|nr:twin-arginine translocase TatA/TatE family subunit [Actinomycetota bacterium]MDP2287169.1 twin-arginine translocase TatA/TatE family subunit [Actinomycetota bacterium]
MFDIGIGEILMLGVIGLLIFGPDRLPKAAADGARFLKQIRTMASTAKQDLADSAGLDINEAMDTVKGLADLHPKRLASTIMREEPATKPAPKSSDSRPSFDPDAT